MPLNGILQKAEHFNRAIQERHTLEGLILPTLVLPPVGRGDYQSGNFENCAIWTGVYIAAQSLRYAITGEQEARDLAKAGVLALHRLQGITGIEGLIARGFKIGDFPTWDEEFFWKKKRDHTRQGNEWHQGDGYRWLGDTSKSQVFGVTFGYFAFNQFCEPTETEKREMGEYLSRIVDRINRSGGKIVDADGQASGYGNYLPGQYWGAGGVGPFLMLAKLRLAGRLTGEDRFDKEYQRLLNEEPYTEFLERCRFNPPIWRGISTAFGSEDNLAMLNYYMLMSLESDDGILQACRTGLEKRWKAINDPQNSLFNFVYPALTQSETPALSMGVDALERFPAEKQVPIIALKRKRSIVRAASDVLLSGRIPMKDRPIDEYAWRINPLRRDEWKVGKTGRMEFTGVDFLIAAYMGIYHQLIS